MCPYDKASAIDILKMKFKPVWSDDGFGNQLSWGATNVSTRHFSSQTVPILSAEPPPAVPAAAAAAATMVPAGCSQQWGHSPARQWQEQWVIEKPTSLFSKRKKEIQNKKAYW